LAPAEHDVLERAILVVPDLLVERHGPSVESADRIVDQLVACLTLEKIRHPMLRDRRARLVGVEPPTAPEPVEGVWDSEPTTLAEYLGRSEYEQLAEPHRRGAGRAAALL
jgi:hypothetical protein